MYINVRKKTGERQTGIHSYFTGHRNLIYTVSALHSGVIRQVIDDLSPVGLYARCLVTLSRGGGGNF